MLKRVNAMLLALVMVFTTVISVNGLYTKKAYADDDKITVVFHFTGASDLNDYRLWLWDIGDGAEYIMENTGDEAVFSKDYDASTLKIGFIVKKGEGWEAKDYATDRFVSLTDVVSGTVHVRIVSKTADFETDKSEAVQGLKMLSAKTTDLKTVNFVLSQAPDSIDDLGIRVHDSYNDEDVEIESIEATNADNTAYAITLANKLDPYGAYEIVYDTNRVFMIGLPDPYILEEFEEAYTYEGDDLGATYSPESTTFRVWAPLATSLTVNIYASGTEGKNDLISTTEMTKDTSDSGKGTWVATIDGDLNGRYYTYTANVSGGTQEDIIDPYARSSGANGKRGMILDLDSTDPEGWDSDTNPNPNENYTDDVLYELHVRDFSYDPSSGISEGNRGKYLAFTETGTTVNNEGNIPTGIDYLKDLGVTHVHILPMYDYGSIDETKDLSANSAFNWGYDPVNFNIPEGSYSTNPYDGEVRVNEAKEMIKSMHDNNLSMVMDVVYGHVQSSSAFSVNRLTPGYYSRSHSSASGCGNDTATERTMNRKFIVDSFKYWANEYHVDGFRIDQEGLFDVDTINAAIEALHEISPAIILYGEGWDMSSTNISKDIPLASQGNSDLTVGCAYFSDNVRDGLKGSVFDTLPGYVSGDLAKVTTVKDAITATPGWQDSAAAVVNYNSCHDNYTLLDRLQITDGNKGQDLNYYAKQSRFAAAIIYTCQGIPFMQAGEEILRTKVKEVLDDGTIVYDENSYAGNSEENAIKWETLADETYSSTRDFYKGLIALRKANPGFRLTEDDDIFDVKVEMGKQSNNQKGMLFTTINSELNGGQGTIYMIYNPLTTAQDITLPAVDEDGKVWNVYVKGDKAGTEILESVDSKGTVNVEEGTALVAICGDPVEEPAAPVSDIVEEGQTIYTIGSAMSREAWNPDSQANMMGEGIEGNYGYILSVPAATDSEGEATGDWAHRFGIIAVTTDTTNVWNRILIGTTVAPEVTDTTSNCLSNIRLPLEDEAYEAFVVLDSTTGAVAVYRYNEEDEEPFTADKRIDYTMSWVGNDDDETYYSLEDYNNFANVGEYEDTLKAKADRTADLTKCGFTADSKLPDFEALRKDLYKKLEGVEEIHPVIAYRTQVQKEGWQDYVLEGATSGTVGKALRLEGIKIKLLNDAGEEGLTEIDPEVLSVSYRTHVQKKGWETEYASNGELSGTVGQALRLEAIQIKLDGALAEAYNVYYRVQAEKLGWLGWAKDDEEAGTAGYGYRLEAIQIYIIGEGDGLPEDNGKLPFYNKKAIPTVSYKTQVQTFGWEKAYATNGATSGTVGKAKRLEAIKIKISDAKGYEGSIQYRTHVQKQGWQKFVADDSLSGTVGKALRLEAIQIKLTGELAKNFDVYYRVQAQKFGWMGWAKNGASAGTSGFGYRLEAIQVQLAYKNTAAPGSTANAYKTNK